MLQPEVARVILTWPSSYSLTRRINSLWDKTEDSDRRSDPIRILLARNRSTFTYDNFLDYLRDHFLVDLILKGKLFLYDFPFLFPAHPHPPSCARECTLTSILNPKRLHSLRLRLRLQAPFIATAKMLPAAFRKKKRRRRKATGDTAAKKRMRAVALSVLRQQSGGLLGVEVKRVDREASMALTTVNAWTRLDENAGLAWNGMGQGDASSQRDGLQASMKSFEVRGIIDCTTAENLGGPTPAALIRIVCYVDKQANGAFALPTQVMNNSQADDFLAFPSIGFGGRKRFTILFDKAITFMPESENEGATNSFARLTTIKQFRYKKVWKNGLKTEYIGTENTISNMSNNAIGFIFCTSVNNGAFIKMATRCTFVG